MNKLKIQAPNQSEARFGAQPRTERSSGTGQEFTPHQDFSDAGFI